MCGPKAEKKSESPAIVSTYERWRYSSSRFNMTVKSISQICCRVFLAEREKSTL